MTKSIKGASSRAIVRVGEGRVAELLEAVVVEEPLEIRFDDESIVHVLRTPGDDARLALGRLYVEEIVLSLGEIGTIAHRGRPGEASCGNVLDIRSDPGAPARARQSRPCLAPSELAERMAQRGGLDGPTIVSASLVFLALESLSAARSAAQHAAVILDDRGSPLARFEDVHLHNAVDKAVGELLRQGLLETTRTRATPLLLAVDGRPDFEMIRRAAVARLPMVASRQTPTSQAVEFADACGITLIAAPDGDDLRLYAHPGRVREATVDEEAPGAEETPPPPRMPLARDPMEGMAAALRSPAFTEPVRQERHRDAHQLPPARKELGGPLPSWLAERTGHDGITPGPRRQTPGPWPRPMGVLDPPPEETPPPEQVKPPVPDHGEEGGELLAASPPVVIDDRDPDHPTEVRWRGRLRS